MSERRGFFWLISKGLIPLTATGILYTRSAGVAYYGACSLACALSAKAVKVMLRVPRPLTGHPGYRKTSYGMPSTHGSAVSFMATYIVLAASQLPLPRSLDWLTSTEEWWLRCLGPLIALVWAFTVTGSRLWLGHHDFLQVLAGIGFGTCFGVGSFMLWTVGGLQTYGPGLENEVERWLLWVR
ncbi:hypothetical protein DL93DRAFT_624934 [Clavulina sp. PMI_390]|nr:hypothetical protein DL93DRAFT_624934 [Clavulina sp. PMI_390]